VKLRVYTWHGAATVQISKRVIDDVHRDFTNTVQILTVHVVLDDHETTRHQQN